MSATFRRRISIAAAALIALFITTARLWLPALGWLPVDAGGPRNADAALVPYSDFIGGAHAVHEAADLLRRGYVRRVLVDAGKPFYGRTVCDYWIPRLPDPSGFECFSLDSSDTFAHFRRAAAEVRRRGYTSVLVIAPQPSSRRYRRVLARFLGGGAPRLYIYGASIPAYTPQTWWQSREGRKIWLIETFKVALTYQPVPFLQSLL